MSLFLFYVLIYVADLYFCLALIITSFSFIQYIYQRYSELKLNNFHLKPFKK